MINLATECDDTNPKIKKKVRAIIHQSVNLIKEILEDGIHHGQFSNELNPDRFAINMINSLEGANALSRVTNSNKPMLATISSLKADLERYCNQNIDKDAKTVSSN